MTLPQASVLYQTLLPKYAPHSPQTSRPEKGVTALVRPPRCLRFASSAWTSSNTSALTIAGWLFST